ncbi:uncharacterized protein LOC129774255 [Toxorhynchites rutilus septentrionalis]|uniref:uncharacterized protein LOC129774255 n=1 Tax=Toxorhynchites rutilus septentrionalis TaxID=329112 RepID=UPI00247AAB58|nr:uncharacterized protein LOC129774255 [Toxorhynchites rutilus septentrionalis]
MLCSTLEKCESAYAKQRIERLEHSTTTSLHLNMNLLTFILFALLATFASAESHQNHTGSDHSRQKRFLLFPRAAPARHQLVAGFGIPVDVTLESITVGYVFKAVYLLPWNSSHWVPQFLRRDEDLLFQQQQQQQRNFVELSNNQQYDTTYENNTREADRSRWTVYKMLEAIVNQKGYDGRNCLLRTICEAAEAKFSHTSGILGELLHILFTPSTTNEVVEDLDHEKYRQAEKLVIQHSPRFGRSICSDVFAECPFSFLDVFTGVTNLGF